MTYRIFTADGTKCIRKFDTMSEAREWCWEHEGYHRIEWQYEDEADARRMYL